MLAVFLLCVLIAFPLIANGTSENEQKIVWKLSHTQSPDHPMHKGAEILADYVSEKTNGNFTIEVFHSGTLGWEQEVLEGMQMGTVAMTMAAVTPFAVFVPEYNLFGVSCLFTSEEQIKETTNNDGLLKPLREAAEKKGLLEMGMYQTFSREVFTKEPINSVDDIKNMKIRVMSAPVLVDTFKALGANVTTTAWAEVYSGLQLGVVEGLDHVPSSIRSMKFNEIVKYGMSPNIFSSPMLLITSKKLYDKLPDTYKQVLQEGVDEALAYLNDTVDAANEADKQYLKDNGMQWTYPDLEPFRELIEPVKQKYLDQLPTEIRAIADDLNS
jgi:tripartite ATP-independent transporter DctP family solute receptor